MATKPNMYRVYLNEEATDLMARICKKTEMGQSELLSKATVAALRAIEECECRVTLPLKFKVVDAPATLPVYKQRDTSIAIHDKKR